VRTLILPYFDYAAASYYDITNDRLGRLQKSMNACVSFIFRLRWDEHVTPFYEELGWLKIRERRKLMLLSLALKIISTGRPRYLFNVLMDVGLYLSAS